jgi:hypothetical protein
LILLSVPSLPFEHGQIGGTPFRFQQGLDHKSIGTTSRSSAKRRRRKDIERLENGTELICIQRVKIGEKTDFRTILPVRKTAAFGSPVTRQNKLAAQSMRT